MDAIEENNSLYRQNSGNYNRPGGFEVVSPATHTPLAVEERSRTDDILDTARSQEIPVWNNYISQEHCKLQPKSYLTPPTSYTTVTNFSPLEGGTECQQ